MRRPRIAIVVSFWLLGGLWAGSARGQEAEPCRNDELEAMSVLVGSWSVVAEVRLALDGPWESSQGRSEIVREVGRCVFVERFVGTRRARPFEFLAILAWNPQRRGVQRLFVDSDHGLLLLSEGRPGEPPGRAIEVFADVETRLGPVRLRTAYGGLTAEGFTVESSRSTDGGATWDVTSRLRYRRVGAEGTGERDGA